MFIWTAVLSPSHPNTLRLSVISLSTEPVSLHFGLVNERGLIELVSSGGGVEEDGRVQRDE